MNLAKRLAIAVAVLAGVALILVWLLLFSTLLAEPRGDLTARIISQRLGANIKILGGAGLSFGPGLRVTARDLVVPGDDEPDMQPVQIAEVSFLLGLDDILNGHLQLSDLLINGAQVSMEVSQDGTTVGPGSASMKWPSLNPNGSTSGRNTPVIEFDRRIRFSDSKLSYRNARNGLDVDVQLSSMAIGKNEDGSPWTLQAKGAVNGQSLTLHGSFPDDKPFTLSAETEQIDLKIDGTPDKGGYADGYSAKISADIAELTQLLKILNLQQSLSGQGTVVTVLKSASGKHSLENLELQLTLDSGQSLELSGNVDEFRNLNTANLKVDISLFPPASMPQPAKLRRDLKLTGFEMVLQAQPDGVPLRQMKVLTNGFVLNTHGKGPPPITVSNIQITPDGLLDLGDVGLRIGPSDGYYVVFDGSVGDALNVQDIGFDASIDIPASIFLKSKQPSDSDRLGKIVGSFHLSGDSKSLSLSDFKATGHGTDLFQLDVAASAENLLILSGLSLNITAETPSGGDILTAMQHASVPIGAAKLGMQLSNDDQSWQSQTHLSVGKSDLNMSFSADTDQPKPKLTGQLDSSLIRLSDIRHLISARRELTSSSESKPKGSGVFSNVSLEPMTTEILQSGLDIDVQIDLKKLDGVAGTSSIQTEFVMVDQKAQVGPVKFEYDGGRIDVTGSVDIADHPDIVTVKGTANGWNFETILQELNVKKHGSGIVNANLNLSGAHRSFEAFLMTSVGDVLVSMHNGTIHTQLLDLAGQGILPWLFSGDHGKVAPIACLRIPLRLDHGKIEIKEGALETQKVQLVANGDVDLRNRTVDVTGQPRPIGKPLSRSPWPFVVSGPLDHPKFALKKGSLLQKRSDGASKMPQERKPCIADILQLR